MKLYVGATALRIGGLSLEAVGAYFRLILLTWERGPVKIAVAEGFLGRDIASLGPLLEDLLTIEDGIVSVDAVQEEKGFRIGKRKQAASAANARWAQEKMRPHSEAHSERNADRNAIKKKKESKKKMQKEKQSAEGEQGIEREDMETPNGVSGFAQPPEEVFVDEPPPEDEGPPDPPSFAQPPQNGDKRHPGVTAVIDYLTAQLKEKGLAEGLDGTKQDNRNFAKHLLNRLKKEFPDFDEVQSAKRMIDFALADPFHSRNAVRVKYLWNNVSKFKAESEAKKNNPKTQSDDDRKQALAAALAKRFAERRAAGTGEN